MYTAALILAAGMSKRMGDFKPMMNIGAITMAQRVVATLQQSGITRIVMVTGYQAEALERHMAGMGLTFIRNEKYDTTRMADSAVIGLNYLKGKCDRVLITPVDVPLFHSTTVRILMEQNAPLIFPQYRDRTGYPILVDMSIAQKINAKKGAGGFKPMLETEFGNLVIKINVEDRGILKDIDTPEDYEHLIRLHNDQLFRPSVNISLNKELPFFDHRTYMLLLLIKESGSVNEACKKIQISYSTGWNIIKVLEHQMDKKIVSRSQGGLNGGSSVLTDFGNILLNCYDGFYNDVKRYTESKFDEYFLDMLWI